MEMLITPSGQIRCIYDEAVDLVTLGAVEIRRASFVEPKGLQWFADLSPIEGPVLGPFECRSAALAAEIRWLNHHWLPQSRLTDPGDS